MLQPAYKDYIWGGTALKKSYNKQTELDPVAESWELSTHPDGESVAASGEACGRTLTALFAEQPALVGSSWKAGEVFPQLIKLIDAKQNLSVQVHPDDAYALKHEKGLGKTEMWYIVDCEPGAFLYLGFERELTEEEFRARIAENTLTEVLRRVPVQPGEAYFIHAKTVHAIGAGILLAEIQQNSNTTYRVYDFGRVGKDGKPRELHLEKAAAVASRTPADFSAPGAKEALKLAGGVLRRLACCGSFTADALSLNGEYELAMDGESFCCVLCTQGECQLVNGGYALCLKQGQSVFVPANCGGVTLSGKAQLLLSWLGDQPDWGGAHADRDK